MSGAALTPAWRTFSFFNAQSVSDRHEPGQPPEVFKSSAEISTICAGQGMVIVADIHGQVYLCNPDLEITKSFLAHSDGRVTHMKLAGAKGILVTLGEEENSAHPVLKVWNIRHDDKKIGSPRLMASGRVVYGTRSHPVSTFAMTASLSLLAIGKADGTVLLLRQLDQYIQSSSTSPGPAGVPKPKLIHSSPSGPITGLGFRTSQDTNSFFTNTITNKTASTNVTEVQTNASIMLFIVTTHQILTYTTTPTGKALNSSSANAIVMDDVGAALGCSTMLTSGEMILAKEEAIFVYGSEGREQSYFYEGAKSTISAYLSYIIIVSPPFIPTASSQSATVRNFVREQRTGQGAPGAPLSSTSASSSNLELPTDISKITIFDPENKFVAYSGAFPEGVREVFCEWGEVFVLTNDSKLSRLVERPTQEKLNLLFSKHLYLLAINLSRSSGLDEEQIAEIYKKYGDHLYDKADFDGAMSAFIKTIGIVQPSYVIRKFLDGQRIMNLTSYLQELHSQNLANSDITTLLLNCYAKLKDTERLDSFITSSSVSSTGELPFDLETAIRVCRQAGYFDHAVYLAKTYNQQEEYLRIQIEDREQWEDAVSYIRGLGQEAAEANLKIYGKTLLANRPDETTNLLVDLCCGTLDIPTLVEQETKDGKPKDVGTKTSYLSYLALNKSLTSPLVSSGISPAAAPASPGLIPPYDRSVTSSSANPSTRKARSTIPTLAITQSDEVGPGRKVPLSSPSPLLPPLPEIRQFFAHYVDQPSHFITFLETVAERRLDLTFEDSKSEMIRPPEHRDDDGMIGKEKEAIWNTLIELYLSEASIKDVPIDQKKSLEEKALRLLRANNDVRPLDITQALLVCTTSSFVPGILTIYERLGMYEDILRFWMDQSLSSMSSSSQIDEASKQVILALQRLGPDGNPELYPLVLRYLTSSPALLTKHQDDLLAVLEYIDAEKIMPPIAVVQALSKSGVATMGMVKEYLRRQIISEQEETDADRSLTASYRADLTKNEKEIQELADHNTPRVFQVTRCSACGGSLDLPAVHFMCRHSYHQRCLADNEASCPTCAASHGVIQEIKAANDQLAGKHDLFMQELEEADDRFESIVSAFSKGLVRFEDE